MGIPSYFSYIVKNHPSIIKKYFKNILNVDNLYLDCNSIIYDAYSKMEFDKLTETVAISIIRRVISKIEEYITTIQPSKTVIVAFDGVAPVAKLEQQRTRRYKSWYQNEISKMIFKKDKNDVWNTTAITPGTNFMAELNNTVSNHFNPGSFSRLNVSNIFVSGSNKVGEGEHKLFDYIQAKTPVVATYLPEIKTIISTYKIGEIIRSHSPEDIANAIKLVCDKGKTYYQKNLKFLIMKTFLYIPYAILMPFQQK